MNTLFILFLFISLNFSCNPTVSTNSYNKVKISDKTFNGANDTSLNFQDNMELSDSTVTMTVSYAAIACGCPQWFESRYNHVPFLEGVERFYLEPINSDLLNANDLWDGKKLPLTITVVGRFSKVKGVPKTYHVKGDPERARIFWYNKIKVISSGTSVTF